MNNYFSIISITLLIIAVLAFYIFYKRSKRHLYSYSTIFYIGFAFFALTQAIIISFVAFIIMPQNPAITAQELRTLLAGSNFNFVIISMPLMLVFSISMTISNISLIKHEGKKFSNILGILISFLLIFSFLFIVIIDLNFHGNDNEYYQYVMISGVYCLIYSYLFCMLFGTIICGIISAKRKIEYNKDYLIILGCRVGKDGHLYPLIKGRVDRAIKFYKEQYEKTNKKVTLIPSGGKGADEGISEGEAMANYLVSQGISPQDIIVEDKAKTTKENLNFSIKLIDKDISKLNIAFSTTNYHILRSGILATEEGIEIEGIGAKTKWYFWPNAFMREFIGLMVKSYKLQILTVIVLTIIFSTINYIIM